MNYTYDLDRFISAQNPIMDQAQLELKTGHKSSHWMWFVFPQLTGLGHSQRASFYGLDGRDEAAAFLNHPVLGPRLIECTTLCLPHADHGAKKLFGQPDDVKFQSSITLFSRVKGADPVFQTALDQFFGGIGCTRTLETLRIAFIASLDE